MFYINLLQLLKSELLTYKVPLLPPIIINNGNCYGLRDTSSINNKTVKARP
jgi:hypothetical protein